MYLKARNWLIQRRLELMVIALFILVIFVSLLPYILIKIPAGHEGVLFRRFFGGTNLSKSYSEGSALIFPWDEVTLYDTRLREVSTTFDALAKNGLAIDVTVSFRFRTYRAHIAKLHKFVGPSYVDVLLIPEMGSHVRSVISSFSPAELYSNPRKIVQDLIIDSIRKDLAVITHALNHDLANDKVKTGEFLYIDDVLVQEITLPQRVREAIDHKEKALQQSLTYDHKIEMEKKEKERKRIEAEGIRDFHNTISDGISDRYLKWKGINATLKLAESNNSKVVVIGSSKSGLPIILGDHSSKNEDHKQKSP